MMHVVALTTHSMCYSCLMSFITTHTEEHASLMNTYVIVDQSGLWAINNSVQAADTTAALYAHAEHYSFPTDAARLHLLGYRAVPVARWNAWRAVFSDLMSAAEDKYAGQYNSDAYRAATDAIPTFYEWDASTQAPRHAITPDPCNTIKRYLSGYQQSTACILPAMDSTPVPASSQILVIDAVTRYVQSNIGTPVSGNLTAEMRLNAISDSIHLRLDALTAEENI